MNQTTYDYENKYSCKSWCRLNSMNLIVMCQTFVPHSHTHTNIGTLIYEIDQSLTNGFRF